MIKVLGALALGALPAILSAVLMLLRPDVMQGALDSPGGGTFVLGVAAFSALGSLAFLFAVLKQHATRMQRAILIVAGLLLLTLPGVMLAVFGPIFLTFKYTQQ